MKKLFLLNSTHVGLISYVAKKLVENGVNFTFSTSDGISSTDLESIEFFAEEYCCDCDYRARYYTKVI